LPFFSRRVFFAAGRFGNHLSPFMVPLVPCWSSLFLNAFPCLGEKPIHPAAPFDACPICLSPSPFHRNLARPQLAFHKRSWVAPFPTREQHPGIPLLGVDLPPPLSTGNSGIPLSLVSYVSSEVWTNPSRSAVFIFSFAFGWSIRFSPENQVKCVLCWLFFISPAFLFAGNLALVCQERVAFGPLDCPPNAQFRIVNPLKSSTAHSLPFALASTSRFFASSRVEITLAFLPFIPPRLGPLLGPLARRSPFFFLLEVPSINFFPSSIDGPRFAFGFPALLRLRRHFFHPPDPFLQGFQETPCLTASSNC